MRTSQNLESQKQEMQRMHWKMITSLYLEMLMTDCTVKRRKKVIKRYFR